ncbi:MAG: hypothetical protein EOM12_09635 [Verrucomicrobiae bacterium]|nr:hypothetical protein [Bacteroidia bacterium]NCC61188.1 hypothetical protein [Verrucomicrobiae bacterium]
MKRYRILVWDFDSRAAALRQEIRDEWEEQVKEQHRCNKRIIKEELVRKFGLLQADEKIQNFIDLDNKPFSVIAFHNRFFEQSRTAFVMGAYYPALTGACALGERILNHLVLSLRDDFRGTPEYKSVHRKSSFDDWGLAITTLESWGVLLPQVVNNFRLLMDKRNKSLHFRPEIDLNPRELALEAINCLQQILGEQFSGFGPQPWFITGIPGEVYIKKEWESRPFVKKIYLPNAALVGYLNQIELLMPKIVINDNFLYENKEISDDEFVALRTGKRRRLTNREK